MKHQIDHYRDSNFAKPLLGIIERLASQCGEVTIMEVCGSHTQAIGRYGIRGLLPKNIRLVSGPGCPVCVTSLRDIDTALFLASCPDVIFVTFGDMLRVPGSDDVTLQQKRAAGAQVVIMSSASEALNIAQQNLDKRVVLMGIGFETTTPTIAATVIRARKMGIKNLFLLSSHKLVPPALAVLIADSRLNIDGFLCPGHVSAIIGAHAYTPLVLADKAAVITGFEGIDVLEGIAMVLQQIVSGKREVAIQYVRAVSYEGNQRALALMEEVFSVQDAVWRGIGTIPQSGLGLRAEFADFDVHEHFTIPPLVSQEPQGCACGDILKGLLIPPECPFFGELCTPLSPVGPCMVSSEGTCAAYYRYHRN